MKKYITKKNSLTTAQINRDVLPVKSMTSRKLLSTRCLPYHWVWTFQAVLKEALSNQVWWRSLITLKLYKKMHMPMLGIHCWSNRFNPSCRYVLDSRRANHRSTIHHSERWRKSRSGGRQLQGNLLKKLHKSS